LKDLNKTTQIEVKFDVAFNGVYKEHIAQAKRKAGEASLGWL